MTLTTLRTRGGLEMPRIGAWGTFRNNGRHDDLVDGLLAFVENWLGGLELAAKVSIEQAGVLAQLRGTLACLNPRSSGTASVTLPVTTESIYSSELRGTGGAAAAVDFTFGLEWTPDVVSFTVTAAAAAAATAAGGDITGRLRGGSNPS